MAVMKGPLGLDRVRQEKPPGMGPAWEESEESANGGQLVPLPYLWQALLHPWMPDTL